jgi:DNA polymerase-3 subunit alpha
MADGEGQGFVHLRVRSAYSLLEGAIKADQIGKLAGRACRPRPSPTAPTCSGRLNTRPTPRTRGPADYRLRHPGRRHRRRTDRALGASSDGRDPDGPERAGLSQSLRTVVDRLSRQRRAARAGRALGQDRRIQRGPDPAVGRTRTGLSTPCSPPARQAEASAALAEMQRAFGDRFYVELQRHGLPNRRRPSRAGQLGLRARRAPGRHQRRLFRQAESFYRLTTRCCASPTVRSSARTSAGASRRALVQAAGRHAQAVRGSAGSLRQHPRYRPPLRLHGAQARPDPAQLPDRPAADEAEELGHQAREGLKMRIAGLAGRAAGRLRKRLAFELDIIKLRWASRVTS